MPLRFHLPVQSTFFLLRLLVPDNGPQMYEISQMFHSLIVYSLKRNVKLVFTSFLHLICLQFLDWLPIGSFFVYVSARCVTMSIGANGPDNVASRTFVAQQRLRWNRQKLAMRLNFEVLLLSELYFSDASV
jgi:hypothetical protein